jgi:hypothetical protein
MGMKFFDRYSFLHFCVGVILSYFNINLIYSIILHTIFEYIENTQVGMRLIRNFTIWPGGKSTADSLTNNIGDTVFFVLGWIVASLVQKYVN